MFDSRPGMAHRDQVTILTIPSSCNTRLIQCLSWKLRGPYPGLDEHFSKTPSSDPICVSLGENGHYFIHNEWGRAWNLPDNIEKYVKSENDDNPVEKLWLGKDDAFVAQRRDASANWNLYGSYGSLDQKINYTDADIRCLGLNLEDDRSYFVMFKDLSMYCNGGRAQHLSAFVDDWLARFREMYNKGLLS